MYNTTLAYNSPVRNRSFSFSALENVQNLNVSSVFSSRCPCPPPCLETSLVLILLHSLPHTTLPAPLKCHKRRVKRGRMPSEHYPSTRDTLVSPVPNVDKKVGGTTGFDSTPDVAIESRLCCALPTARRTRAHSMQRRLRAHLLPRGQERHTEKIALEPQRRAVARRSDGLPFCFCRMIR